MRFAGGRNTDFVLLLFFYSVNDSSAIKVQEQLLSKSKTKPTRNPFRDDFYAPETWLQILCFLFNSLRWGKNSVSASLIKDHLSCILEILFFSNFLSLYIIILWQNSNLLTAPKKFFLHLQSRIHPFTCQAPFKMDLLSGLKDPGQNIYSNINNIVASFHLCTTFETG